MHFALLPCVAIALVALTTGPLATNAHCTASGQLVAFTGTTPTVKQFSPAEDVCQHSTDCCCTAQGTIAGAINV